MNKRFVITFLSLLVGIFLLSGGILWNNQTEKSNAISGHDDINIIAGYMLVIGVFVIFTTLLLQLMSYFAKKK